MGNQNGKDFGGVVIRTDKPYYFAGEMVTGNIYMSISQDGFPGSVVMLHVSGKEVCKWDEQRTVTDNVDDGKGGTTSNSRTVTETFHGKNQFYSHKIAIHTFNQRSLPRGQYVFPFQFTLLGHLPGTFFEQTHTYKAAIKYKVKAIIESYDKHHKAIKHHQDMTVREPLKTNIQALQGEMEVKAKTWCCIDQGKSHIKCVFDKNNYLPGDTAYLWVDLDNSECSLDISQINACLTNYVTLRSKQGREKTFTREIARQDIPGILAQSKAVDDQRKMMQVTLNDSKSTDGMGIKPTTHGQIVKSTYELSATAHLSGCICCGSHPSVKVPIVIVAPVPMMYNQPPAYPSNWNPQVFQPQLVTFTDKDLYVKQDGQGSNYGYPSENQGMNQMAQPYMN